MQATLIRTPRREWLILALPVLLLLWAGIAWRWTSDDGFIHMRVIDNVLAGHGPVFNPGERVEASTSPLWTWLLVALSLLVPRELVDLPTLSAIVGISLSVAGFALGVWGTTRLVRADAGASGPLLPVGALVIAALPVVGQFTTAGLEGGLVFGWIGGLWAATAALVLGGRRAGLAATWIGLAPLIRPDLVLLALPFGVWLLARERGLRARLRLLLLAAALPLLYEIFRAAYFGLLVPNPALAKEGLSPRPEQGLAYLFTLLAFYGLPIPLLGAWRSFRHVALMGATRTPTRLALLATLLHGGYVVLIGGDFMLGRLLLPALWIALLPIAVVGASRLRSLDWIVVVGWAMAAALIIRPLEGPDLFALDIANERAFYVHETGVEVPLTLADWSGHPAVEAGLAAREQATGPRAAAWAAGTDVPRLFGEVPLRRGVTQPMVLAEGIGAVGYAAGPGVYVADMLSVADPIGSHLRLETRGRPGHEKPLPLAWLLARWADPAWSGAVEGSTRAELEAARVVLRCPAIAELLAATSDPLTPERLWANLTGALGRTLLRFPADPLRAADCEDWGRR